MVLSLELPEPLKMMTPVVAVMSLQSIRRFPAGVAKKPERLIEFIKLVPPLFTAPAEEMTVVPSHNLQSNWALAAVSLKVTVPETHHVPDAPCATLGRGNS